MTETNHCPFCGKENRPEDYYCRFCDGDLKRPSTRDHGDHNAYKNVPDSGGPGDEGSSEIQNDEFAELDYQPKGKAGCFIPGLVILLALVIIGVGILVLNEDLFIPVEEEEAEAPELELPEEESGNAEVEEEPEPDPEPEPEEEPEETEPNGEEEPDYDQLEAALLNWLINRIDNPRVTLLHVDEAQDPEKFFEEYDLTEEEVIVYKEESWEDEFVTVKIGLPFSEWSMRAVFIWDQVEWRFLREEEVR